MPYSDSWGLSKSAAGTSSSSESTCFCQRFSSFMKRHRRHGSSNKKPKGTTVTQEPSSKAPWRIGAEDTPSAKDWWENENDETDVAEGASHNDNDDDGGEDDDGNDGGEEDERKVVGSKGRRKFNNVGLENWEKSRKRWRVRVVTKDVNSLGNREEGKVAIKLSDRVRIQKGLKEVQRTFELPVKISLPDVIGIYQDIWYSDAD